MTEGSEEVSNRVSVTTIPTPLLTYSPTHDCPPLLAKRKPARRKPTGSGSGVGVRRTTDGRGWVLVHPPCARERAEDLEEVRAMIEGGEEEVAVDELRWLVGGCSEFIEGHALLGELALSVGDPTLARGHFGFAVQLGIKALERAKASGPLSYSQPANQSFHEAGRGLVEALLALQMMPKAIELVQKLTRLDSSDPLGLRALIDAAQSGGLPIVELE
jgi:hypothetical protein